jgi:hypothetical protein
MNKCLGYCIVLASAMIMGMEPDIPDQKTVKAQVAAVVQACFKNHPPLTKREEDYALTALAELYVENENRILRDLQQGTLKVQDKDRLRMSVLSQIEGKIDRILTDAQSEVYQQEREEREQQVTSSLTTVLVSSITACLILNALLGYCSFI